MVLEGDGWFEKDKVGDRNKQKEGSICIKENIKRYIDSLEFRWLKSWNNVIIN